MEAGVHCLRLNPGNIRKPEHIKTVAAEARDRGLPIRIGVNGGSLDPALYEKYGGITPEAMVESALQEMAYFHEVDFHDMKISVKASNVPLMVEAYRQLSEVTDVPLHLGVTEAGMPPDGIIKTRIAFEQLVTRGIGDTIRVSLTLPFERKGEEITVGRQILDDIATGRFRSVPRFEHKGLNIISCPSCSRVENEAFIDLAQNVKEMAQYAKEHDITIAVMGCRVNGPGETDDADLGMWCAPSYVNLKRGTESLGHYTYDEILGRLRSELDRLIEERRTAGAIA
jgi:(E)-4-hydroxy-3-methylbut-2-enyl-diphosphate synthase